MYKPISTVSDSRY